MKRKGLAVFLALMLVLSVSMVAFADTGSAPGKQDDVSVTITPASTDLNRISVEQGGTVLLTATAALKAGNYEFVSDDWSDNVVRQTGPNVGDERSGSGQTFVSTAVFSAVGLEVGDKCQVTYEIKVCEHGGGPDGTEYSDSDEAYIEVIESGTVTIVVEPMAAPAVAAHILKFNEVEARYGTGKSGGNYIADVAKVMGPQTLFNGVEKGIWDEEAGAYVSNPDYWTAVLNFLNTNYNLNLDMPNDEWLEANL